MQVTGQILLFRNDFGFSTSISNKKQDGTYENLAVSVMFKKDDLDAQKIPNKTKINIKNGFLSFYKGTNGFPKIRVVILEYDILDNIPETSSASSDPFDDMNITENMVFSDDDELPF